MSKKSWFAASMALFLP